MKAWITRDKNGQISIFNVKPIKNKGLGFWHFCKIEWGVFYGILNPDDIQDINPQWEDEKPIKKNNITKV